MENIFWGRCNDTKNFDQDLFKKFLNLPKEELLNICNHENNFPKHIIKSEFFSVSFLEHIYSLAKALKKLYRGNPFYLKNFRLVVYIL